MKSKKSIRIIIFYSFFILFFLQGNSQNLVPNYSFEDTIKCPTFWDQFVGYVANWQGGGAGGNEYFNSFCSPSGSVVGVPKNYFGYQVPHSGHAYSGFYTMLKYSIDTMERGGIEAKLTSPLLAGTTYYATFYVSLANVEEYACNNIGVYFSDTAVTYFDHFLYKIHPQIENDPIGNPLTDTLNWIKVSGKYKAIGGEQYMVIANFLQNYLCDTVFEPYGSPGEISAFYYIDDVILSPDSNFADSLFTVGEKNLASVNEQVKIYPNPANTKLAIEVALENGQKAHLDLYDALGRHIEAIELKDGITTLPMANLAERLYYYRVLDENGKLLKADKEMIIH